MGRSILAGLVGCLLAVSPLHAQTSPPAEAEGPSHVLAWILAVIFTLAILIIVCMPSRKSHQD